MYGPAPQHCRLVKARLHTHTDTYAYGYGASVDSIFNSGLDARTAREQVYYIMRKCAYISINTKRTAPTYEYAININWRFLETFKSTSKLTDTGKMLNMQVGTQTETLSFVILRHSSSDMRSDSLDALGCFACVSRVKLNIGISARQVWQMRHQLSRIQVVVYMLRRCSLRHAPPA